MINENKDIDLYYKKKSYYNNLKARQIAKIRKDGNLNKKEKTEKAKKIKLPCIFCKKLIGTIFEKKDGYLIARCGGSGGKECSNIMKIRTYMYTTNEVIKKDYHDDINEIKENIIKLKCHSLFRYIDDNEAGKKFSKYNEDLSLSSEIYLHILRKYTNHLSNINYVNDDLQELIKELNDKIMIIKDTFKKHKEEDSNILLSDIASIYKNEIVNLNKQIRKIKYKNLEVITEQEDENKYISKLKYNTHTPFDIEEFYDIEDELKSKSPENKLEEEEPKLEEKKIVEKQPEKIVEEEKIKVDGNEIKYQNNVILNKIDYKKNKELLEDMTQINASEANNKKYQFEMIKTGETNPVLIAIDPEDGKVYKILAGQ